jgi:hypothetical protein
MPDNPRIDCRKCRHYYITWEASFPHGCTLYEFKGKLMPSGTVWEATGKACEHFAQVTKKIVRKKT